MAVFFIMLVSFLQIMKAIYKEIIYFFIRAPDTSQCSVYIQHSSTVDSVLDIALQRIKPSRINIWK